jgi:membrane-bound metal-dependent hydrolase YbcI (DUF457 family)
MAALGHLAVGLAAKRVAPEMNVGYLILGAYVLDILWFGFNALGMEPLSKPPVWDHSLLMGMVWSVLFGVIAARTGRNARAGVVFGLMVFSHWVVDFITHPMTALSPTDRGLPLWFGNSPLIGLGLYSTMAGVWVTEIGSVIVGLAIYIWARKRMKRMKASIA